MPGKRIDVYRDLDPDVAEEIQKDLEALVELERRWIEEGDEEAYAEWKRLADRTFARAKENRVSSEDEDAYL